MNNKTIKILRTARTVQFQDVKSMQNLTDNTCNIVQYADDILLFFADKCVDTAKHRLPKNC